MVAEDPGTLTGQIEALLSDEERQAAVAREIENLRRPEAAEAIVNDIMRQWFTPPEGELVLTAEGSSYIG